MEESSTTEVFVSIVPTIPANGTEFTMVNGSNGTFPQPVELWWTLDLLNLIISLVGLAGNAILLWLLGFCMCRNAFLVYILNLAGADFLFLCFHVIISLEELTHTLVSIVNFILKYSTIVVLWSYLTGLGILSATSAECCLSVLLPIWYRCHHLRHTSGIMCALLWALSLLLSILNVSCNLLSMNVYSYWCPTFDFITAAWLIFLFMVLSGSLLTMLIRILCGSQRVPPTRLYVTIGLTALVFLFCGLPIGIVHFLLFWIQENHMIEYFSARIAFFLSSINSSANPIIYFFVGSCRRGQHYQWKQQSLRLVLEKSFQDIPEVEKSGESLPQETMESSASP